MRFTQAALSESSRYCYPFLQAVPFPRLESHTRYESSVTITSLASGIACQSLWQRQGDSTKDYPAGLYAGIVNVRVKKLELFVKKIGRSNRDETVPLRQTVSDPCIDCPEVICTRGKLSPSKSLPKRAILIEVRRC